MQCCFPRSASGHQAVTGLIFRELFHSAFMNNLIDNFFYWHPLEDLDALLDVMTRINDEEHLRMIFDASNLLEFPEKTDQDAYWKTWLDAAGKYIEAMHIKDFYLDNDRNYCPCPLGERSHELH